MNIETPLLFDIIESMLNKNKHIAIDAIMPIAEAFHLSQRNHGKIVSIKLVASEHATPEILGTYYILLTCLMSNRGRKLAFDSSKAVDLRKSIKISAASFDERYTLKSIPAGAVLVNLPKSV